MHVERVQHSMDSQLLLGHARGKAGHEGRQHLLIIRQPPSRAAIGDESHVNALLRHSERRCHAGPEKSGELLCPSLRTCK